MRISKNQFDPGCLGIVINPYYFPRKSLADGIRKLSANIKGNVLDVGCGTKPYREFFNCSKYTGLEIDSKRGFKNCSADVFYDGKNFPSEDSIFDAVIINQVFEHIFEPENFLSEITRVLKPKGKLLLTVPFLWDEHEQPHDYARYSSFGLKSILERHGFKIISHDKSVNNFKVIFQLINAYLYKKLICNNKYINYVTILTLMFTVNLAGILFGNILPANNDLYLDNIVLAEKHG